MRFTKTLTALLLTIVFALTIAVQSMVKEDVYEIKQTRRTNVYAARQKRKKTSRRKIYKSSRKENRQTHFRRYDPCSQPNIECL